VIIITLLAAILRFSLSIGDGHGGNMKWPQKGTKSAKKFQDL
jgi:hypothetical protein